MPHLRQHAPRAKDPLRPWLLRAYLLAAGLLVIAALKVLPFGPGRDPAAPIPGPAWTAAVGLGGIGIILGAICGWQRHSVRSTLFGIVLFGVAGICGGFSIGGLMATLVSPVNRSLSTPSPLTPATPASKPAPPPD